MPAIQYTVITCDHCGVEFKEAVAPIIIQRGKEVIFLCDSLAVDFDDYLVAIGATAVANVPKP